MKKFTIELEDEDIEFLRALFEFVGEGSTIEDAYIGNILEQILNQTGE